MLLVFTCVALELKVGKEVDGGANVGASMMAKVASASMLSGRTVLKAYWQSYPSC